MGRPGRPSKGLRKTIAAKPALPFGALLEENARRLGLSAGDYLVLLAAERLSMPQYAPKMPGQDQPELDFALAGSPTVMSTSEELRSRMAS